MKEVIKLVHAAVIELIQLTEPFTGALKICKEKDKKGCDKLQSEDKCVNLEKEENWVSGHAVGEELQCIIYKNHDCKGAFVSVEHEGWAEFPIKPKSFTCPCVAKEKKKD